MSGVTEPLAPADRVALARAEARLTRALERRDAPALVAEGLVPVVVVRRDGTLEELWHDPDEPLSLGSEPATAAATLVAPWSDLRRVHGLVVVAVAAGAALVGGPWTDQALEAAGQLVGRLAPMA